MIAKHSHEQSQKGEGVEVIENRPHEVRIIELFMNFLTASLNSFFQDPEHGSGQYTEKRIYIGSKLPSWIRKMVPKTFYVTEKAWNYYPFTITEYSCSFLTCAVNILTKYENNNGSTENCLNASKEVLEQLTVDHVDIAMDQCAPHHFKVRLYRQDSGDSSYFKHHWLLP